MGERTPLTGTSVARQAFALSVSARISSLQTLWSGTQRTRLAPCQVVSTMLGNCPDAGRVMHGRLVST
jgi:hypothetical protein